MRSSDFVCTSRGVMQQAGMCVWWMLRTREQGRQVEGECSQQKSNMGGARGRKHPPGA